MRMSRTRTRCTRPPRRYSPPVFQRPISVVPKENPQPPPTASARRQRSSICLAVKRRHSRWSHPPPKTASSTPHSRAHRACKRIRRFGSVSSRPEPIEKSVLQLLPIHGLPWLEQVATVANALQAHTTHTPVHNTASVISDFQDTVIEFGESMSSMAIRQFACDALCNMNVRFPSQPEFISNAVTQCMHLINDSIVCRRFWYRFHRSYNNLHWSMISDHECFQFCLHVLDYTQSVSSEPAFLPCSQFWSPLETWWDTLFNVFNIDGTIGTTSFSRGSQHTAFTGPMAPFEHRFGALPSPHDVACRSRRILLLPQPGDSPGLLTDTLRANPDLELAVFGIPHSHKVWIEYARKLCKNGNAWCAFEEKYSVSCPLFHPFYTKHQRKKFVNSPVSWFVTTPTLLEDCCASANGAPLFNIYTYIAALSARAKNGRGFWNMPPARFTASMGKGPMRVIFRASMERDTEFRDNLYSSNTFKPHSETQKLVLSTHLEEMRTLLHFAPQTWIRKLFGLSKALSLPYLKPGLHSVYVVFSLLDSKVYVGRTDRPLVVRFLEHIAGAMRALFHIHRGEHEFLEGLDFYSAMARKGLHHFLILPLEVCHQSQHASVEKKWIRYFGANVYNQRDTAHYCHLKWKLLKRIQASTEICSRQRVKTIVGYIQKNRRIALSLPTLLDTLTVSKSIIPRQEWNDLFRKVSARVHQRVGIHLPQRLPFPYPASNDPAPQDIKSCIQDTISQSPLPLPLRSYLRSAVQLTSKSGCTVRDHLCTRKIQKSWDYICRRSSHCACSHVSGVHTIQNCVCTRDPSEWQTLFGPEYCLLTQHMGNRTITTWESMEGDVVRCAKRIATVSRLPDNLVGTYCAAMVHKAKSLHTDTAHSLPWYLRPERIKEFKRKWGDRYVFLVVDKNPGRTWVMCKRLFFSYIRILYSDPEQFEILGDFPTVVDAKVFALQKLMDAARQFGLTKYFRCSARTSPPVSFPFLKHKSDEFTDTLKWRLLFSHFSHPMKQHGRLISRCLTLLISAATQMLDTWAILDVRDVRAYVEKLNSAMARLYPSGPPPRKKLRLFELDVREMFPRLPRDGVIEAISQIADALADAIRAAPPSPKPHIPSNLRVGSNGLLFSIHRRNRKLDRLGRGYTSDFHILSMSDVLAYMNFDVYHNDIFVIGSRVAKQKRGVAIGGLCSAQAAQLFCMMRELSFNTSSGSPAHKLSRRLPKHALPIPPYRYMDNIVGAICGNIGLTRLQRMFEKLYGLELQQESEGLVIPSLEAVLCVLPDTAEVSMRLKTKVDWSVPPHKRFSRFPDPEAVQAKRSTKSIAVTLGLKSAGYSTRWSDVQHNALACVHELHMKRYPTSWWKPGLYSGLTRSNLCDRDLVLGLLYPPAPSLPPVCNPVLHSLGLPGTDATTALCSANILGL